MVWRFRSYTHMITMGFNNRTRLGDLYAKRELIIDELPCFQHSYADLSGHLFDTTDKVEQDLTYLTQPEIKQERKRQKLVVKER